MQGPLTARDEITVIQKTHSRERFASRAESTQRKTCNVIWSQLFIIKSGSQNSGYRKETTNGRHQFRH